MLTVKNLGYQAIETKYVGPSNVRGSRIIATAEAGRVVVSYDHSKNLFENHAAACEALCRKFGWTGHYVGGGTRHGYAFVCTGEANP